MRIYRYTFLIVVLFVLLGCFFIVLNPKKAGGVKTIYPLGIIPTVPGVSNSKITQANIKDTLCNKNWKTSSIRPYVSYTNKLKAKQIAELKYPDTKMADYEEDHAISIELGGSPTDPSNLWPQPYNISYNGELLGAKQKDRIENYLHIKLCDNSLSLREVQYDIVFDWPSIYLSIEKKAGSSISDLDQDDN